MSFLGVVRWPVRATLAVLLTAAQSLSAQQVPSGRVDDRILAVATPTTALDGVAITLPTVLASGEPRSYQVVSVPVPEALAKAHEIVVEIFSRGEFVVLGPRSRTIKGGETKRIGVTIGIPASAGAGRLTAAEVRFSASFATFLVPVDIDVTLVRNITLRQSSAPLHAQAGGDVFVPLEIINGGNARETVDATLALPTGWARRDIRQNAILVMPGQTVKRRVRVAIPQLSSTGTSFVRIDLHDGEQKIASQDVRIEVLNVSSIGRGAGPQIVSAISHATGVNGAPSSIFTMSANGALFDSVRVNAQMSHSTSVPGSASNAFARLGTFQSAPSLVLSAPSARLSLGNTGASFTELTGLFPYGQGVLFEAEKPEWSVTGLGALSIAPVSGGERKPVIGIKGSRDLGGIRLTTSASHLADAGISPRTLDAVGVGAAVPSWFGSTFRAEVAERRFMGGSGFGWSSGLVRTGPESNEELRFSHAPGGSDAFARATDEIVANVSERVSSRANISGSFWRTSDATSVFSSLSSRGYSVRPQYALTGSTTIAIELRSYLFNAYSRQSGSNPGGGFGSREDQLGMSISKSVREFHLNSAAYLGTTTRSVSPIGQSAFAERTPRNYWSTNAGWAGVGGAIEIQTRIEQTRDGSGLVNQQSMFGIRGDQVVLPMRGGIRAEGELQHVSGFGNQVSSILRAGLMVPLINGFSLKVEAERNSVFHTVNGGAPWIFGARFEHMISLPMIRTPGSVGYVYRDLNGNQRRDPGEAGVSGAIVRRGSETAITDEYGKYRLSGDVRQPVLVDEASLPDGWSAVGSYRGDVSVTLSSAAEVELRVAARSGISEVQVDLSKAHVIARDSAGREWAARMTGPTTATFEALPVGGYTLEFDLSELSEPLVPRAPVPTLVVTGTDLKSVTVMLDPRPIRMWPGKVTPKSLPPIADDSKSPSGGVR